ncbi:MAG TPA: lysine 5,6-aminomutase subunit alpha, partial [Geodermatophilus sp.]|nr:lysine 5,6-aminomutase subunit alpha [Geodermatophilus sp.]
MTPRLSLDPVLVGRARELAARAARPVVDLARRHTTVSVERAVLRLAGLTGTDPVTGDGAGADRVPWVNRVVDAVREQVGLEGGVALPVWHALATGGAPDLQALAEQVGAGTARFSLPTGADAERARAAARDAVGAGIARIDANRRRREELVAVHGDPPRRPWIYLIVATGDIHEDIPQAQAAARAGADVIAVIRSTGQSLLDY